MMRGKIIRGVGGFYYIHPEDADTGVLVECRAKGIFRSQNIKPLVGDDAKIEVLEGEDGRGSIVEILPRRNELLRPAAANVDQAAVVSSLSYPRTNFNLLDRFLLMMRTQDIPVVICFNKSDDQDRRVICDIVSQYEGSGATILVTSAVTGEGIEDLRAILAGATTVMAGPSGVGKSSIMNVLFPEARMATGEISAKIRRGKHTTRHTEMFCIGAGTYIMDTPGFTSLRLPELEKEDLQAYYPEFERYRDECRFLGCTHIHEPDCGVRAALKRREIPAGRYENYRQFFKELARTRKY